MTVALFDWDGFVYRSAFATQQVVRHVTVVGGGDESHPQSFESAADMKAWLEDNELTKDDVLIEEELKVKPAGHAIRILKNLFVRSHGYLHADSAELYLTGKDNFRNMLFEDYKANRKGKPKPANFEEVRKYSIKQMGAEVIDGMEADDKLAIRAMELEAEGKEWVIVSNDKDMLTVPGHHYDPFKEVYQVVDPHEAAFNFYCQCLTGDSADNIPGIYKVGKVKAAAILEDAWDEKEMYDIVKGVYAENNYDEEVLIRNARLLHMLRHPLDLWNPPTENTDATAHNA